MVSVAFNSSSISSIRYGGTEFLYSGDISLSSVQFGSTPGSVYSYRSINQAQRTITDFYNWGQIEYDFIPRSSNLFIDIRITNQSFSTLTQFGMNLMTLRFPLAPSEYDGSTPILANNIGDPTAFPMTYGVDGTMVVTNEDVINPLLIGFPFSINRPTSTIFPFTVTVGRNPIYPTSFPFINRPITTGNTLSLRLSFRFGPSGSTAVSLADDIFREFAQAFPFSVNHTDKRSIGQLIIATANAGFPTNPRGWFNDPSVDVTTPSGIAAFQARLLAFADNAVSIMQNMDSQGMITWDIEGEQYPHPTTYIGDPRIATTLAPELIGVIDQYFQRFTNAGFTVGVTIRPQQFINGVQTEVSNPAQLLIDKIAYANSHWGATLFYVDSNFDTTLNSSGYLMSASVFQQVHAAFPNVLLIPEHQNTEYYSVSAPYDELRAPFFVTSTPSSVRPTVYPDAFTIINVSDGDIDGNHDALVTAVENGDVLLYRAWFNSAENAKVRQIYIEAGGGIADNIYYSPLTVDHNKVPADQTDFTVLINLTDNRFKTIANGGHVFNSNGYDIRPYSDTALTTPLTYELERYNASTGEVVMHVKITALSSSTNFTFYLGYGDSSFITDGSTNPFDSHYKGVYHLPNGTTLTTLDSTGTSNGTVIGDVTATSGQIDGGALFSDVSVSLSYIDCSTAFNPTACTASGWVNASAYRHPYNISIIGRVKIGSLSYYLVYIRDTGQIAVYVGGTGGQVAIDPSPSSLSLNTSYHVAVTYDSISGLRIYLNGVLDSSAAPNGPLFQDNTVTNVIGQDLQATLRNWNGMQDEIRFSDIARTQNWIITEYNNQFSPSTFMSLGTEVLT